VDQAAAAEIANDLEAHRVAEEGQRLIFADQHRYRAAAHQKSIIEHEQRRRAVSSMQATERAVEQPEDQRLAGEDRGEEGGDLERRVEHLRLAEASAEQ